MSDIITVAVITAVPSTIAAVGSIYNARHGRQTRTLALDSNRVAKANNQLANINNAEIQQIKNQTNGLLQSRVKEAMIEVWNERQKEVTREVMLTSMADLLNAMIGNNTD